MANEKFKVPCSSLSELKKIIEGYAHLENSVTLPALSKLVGINVTTISPNNPFLAEVGLIDKSKAKSVTPLGKKLGRAIHHNRHDEVKEAWQEVIRSNEFLSNLVSTVRIKKGMSEADLASHVLFAADLKKNKASNTGANTIVAILKEASMLAEDNGKLVVPTSSDAPPVVISDSETLKSESTPPALAPTPPPATVGYATTAITSVTALPVTPTIAINIQLQLPETENATVYDNLFKSLRKHLLSPDDKTND